MIKLSNCGDLHTKYIERWKSKTKSDKKIWASFHQYLILEYEKMLAER